ncbi:MAG: DUF1559 domain-containing protein [Planctomycetota bacterium]
MDQRCHGRSAVAPRSCGFTVCELLVAFACVALVLSLLLPAVVSARESARRSTCESRLRQIGVAVHAFHESQRRLPAAWHSSASERDFLYAWATELLPEIGEAALADRLRRSANAAANLSDASLALWLCPSDITAPSFDLRSDAGSHAPAANGGLPMGEVLRSLPTANYVAVFGTTKAGDQYPDPGEPNPGPGNGPIVNDNPVRLACLQRGASRTTLIGERTMSMLPSTWLGVDASGEEGPCRVVASAITRPNCRECDECEFSSRHRSGVNFLWADGRVAFMSESVETALYRRYSQRFND